MNEPSHLFISTYIRLFFLLTPFFVLSVFLSLTRDIPPARRRTVAAWLTFDVILIGLVLYFLGNAIFSVFGITLDAFRVGAGALLFLSAVDLVRGTEVTVRPDDPDSITVVPLAIPITIGPATTGALLVMGAEVTSVWGKIVGCSALLAAVLSVGMLLFLGTSIERIIGCTGLRILSKLTGLVLAALAAQIVFTGVRNFLA
ncbi:MAG TPA: MarC family protein [Deltaproteobacteria bacterium]|jgi:multiple antibiotic resistance protein|nr:MarC family protein [Deltaproteobacteria bacterium]MDI9543307.1 MarC family protein [Pseudomonadota bacterium]NLW69011.1 MarC family protein [Bacteriovoracaceae bacterium]HRR21801.1 MarC family protein [Desulfomonilia bacterium]HNR50328.1 MarC family protein [Deltaproteobacteria bacterium]